MNASDYYKYAQLATAAYVDLSLELNLADGQRLATIANQQGRLPTALAQQFFDAGNGWAVLGDPRHLVTSGNLPRTLHDDPASGFAATLFRNKGTNEKVLAIRGTDPSRTFLQDLVEADLLHIGTIGIAVKQVVSLFNLVQRMRTDAGQAAIQLRVVQGIAPTSTSWIFSGGFFYSLERATDGVGQGMIASGDSLVVVGHSLGGHLAAIARRLFPELFGSAVIFNAPGYDPLTSLPGKTTAFIELFRSFGANPAVDFTNVTSLISEDTVPGDDATIVPSVLTGTRYGVDIPVRTELNSHVIEPFMDSLGVQALMSLMSGNLSAGDLGKVLDAFSVTAAESDEKALSELFALFTGARPNPSLPIFSAELASAGDVASRRQYYSLLLQVEDAIKNSALPLSVSSLVEMQRSELITRAAAENGLPYRYALSRLNPIAILGPDAIYSTLHNSVGELNLHALASGGGAISEQWIADRVAFLAWKSETFSRDRLQTADLQTRQSWRFEDLSQNLLINVGAGQVPSTNPTTEPNQVVFGSAESESLNGGRFTDRLYGEQGDDTLTGGQGNDYLEGGRGDDFYYYWTGDEDDTILDVDGVGKIFFDEVELGSGERIAPYQWRFTSDFGREFYYWQRNENDGSSTLTITAAETPGSITVRGFQDGELGISLPDFVAPVRPGGEIDAGTEGNDVLREVFQLVKLGLGGDDILWGKPNSWLEGGSGNDLLAYEYFAGHEPAGVSAYGGEGSDFAFGTVYDDELYAEGTAEFTALMEGTGPAIGGAEREVFFGAAGDDIVAGGRGDDWVAGGIGADTLYGGAGNDILSGAGEIFFEVQQPGLQPQAQTIFNVHTSGRYDQTHPTIAINWPNAGLEFFGFTSADLGTVIREGLDDSGWRDGSDVIFAGAGDDEAWGGFGDDTIAGEDGNDTLRGESGNDILDGGAGNDRLIGGQGNDVLIGGAGADILEGGEGDDLYLADAGDTIKDTQGKNTIRFGAEVRREALRVTQSGADLVLTGAQGGTVTVEGGLAGALAEVDIEYSSFTFGEFLSSIAADDLVVDGSAADEAVFGASGNDRITAGQGSDLIDGGTGDDAYVFNLGDGFDVLTDVSGANVVEFGEGIDAADITASVFFDFNRAGYDLHVGYGPGDTVAIVDGHAGAIAEYRFADGTTLTHADVIARDTQGFLLEGSEADDVLQGGGGNDVLLGQAGNDRLIGRGGNDSLSGSDGNDTLEGGEGNDTLFGEAGEDVISGGAGDDQLLAGEGADSVEAGDGNDVLEGEAGNDTLEAGAGNDVVRAGSGDDVLVGGAGSDRLEGGEGSDTYLLGAGDGADIVDDISGANQIQFGAGITPDSVGASIMNATDGGIYLSLQYGSADYLLVKQDPARPGAGEAIFSFANGENLSQGELMARSLTAPLDYIAGPNPILIYGSRFDDQVLGSNGSDFVDGGAGNDVLQGEAGNDVLIGGEGDDLLLGGTGDDTLTGGLGSDVYALRRGMGRDTVIDDPADAAVNTLKLASDTAVADLAARRQGDDLYLHVKNLRDGVVVSGFFSTANSAANWQVQGADGAITSLADVLSSVQDAERAANIAEAYAQFEARARAAYESGLYSDGWTPGPDGRFHQELTRNGTFFSSHSLRDIGTSVVSESDDGVFFSRQSAPVLLTGQTFSQTQTAQTIQVLDTSNSLVVSMPDGGNRHDAGGPPRRMVNINDLLEFGVSGIMLPETVVPIYGDEVVTRQYAADPTPQQRVAGLATYSGGAQPIYITQTITHVHQETTDSWEMQIAEIDGGASDNIIDGGAGFSLVDGGAGADRISAQGGIYLPSGPLDVDAIPGALLYGNAGNDELTGSVFDDVLIGGADADVMNGGDGNDTYLLFAGDGDDVIFDDGATVAGIGRENVIEMPDGLTLADLSAVLDERIETFRYRVPADGGMQFAYQSATAMFASVNLSWEGGSARIVLPHTEQNAGTGIDLLRFSDGSTATMADVFALAGGAPDVDPHNRDDDDPAISYGGGGDDTMYGGIGGAGRDTFIGSAFDDEFFGAELVLEISFDFTGGAPALSTLWDEGNVYRGAGGNDTLWATAGSDVFEYGLGEGTDTVTDMLHDETFIYGYGGPIGSAQHFLPHWQDPTAVDPAHQALLFSSSDTLKFGAGIAPSDVVFYRERMGNRNDLRISVDGSEAGVLFKNWYSAQINQLGRVEFAGGTVWDAGEIASKAASAPLVVRGRLIGTPENELFLGGSTDDTYFIWAGGGQDRIQDPGGFDRLSFEAGPDNVTVTREGNDIVIAFDGTADRVAIPWFADPATRVEEVNFVFYGVQWDAATLESMIEGATNEAPTIANPIADQTASEDAAFSFAVPANTFSDADGDTLTLSATGLPSWLSFDGTTFSGTPQQADVGAVDLTIRAADDSGAWVEDVFTLNVANVNDVPVVSAGHADVLIGQSVLASSLFSVTDDDGDAITQYEFWDDAPVAGGHFSVDGVAQGANPIVVGAAQLDTVSYHADDEPGTEQVWVRAYDGAAWSAWKAWLVTSALHVPNAAPEITAQAAQTVALGQVVGAGTLFTATDADADPIARYEFWDSTEGNGHFVVGGIEQSVNVAIAVANLADAQFVGASETASDLVWVRASDGQTWGEWKSWTMNSWPHVTNAAPVAAASNASLLTNEVALASSLFSVSDADGDAIVRYEFWDDINGGGYWRVNGVQQAAVQAIGVSAAELADAYYVAGFSGGTEQVWVRANDGLEWGAWKPWTMTSALHIPNAAPVVSASSSQTVLLGQPVGAGSLFTVTDADADAITAYEFWDSTAGAGHWAIDGIEQGVNVSIAVSDLEDVDFVGASEIASDLVWVRANDGQTWSDWKAWTMQSSPHLANAAPVVSAANGGLLRDEALDAAALFSVSDADGDAITQYQFWDDVNGGGHWRLNGVQQAAGQNIDVAAADLENLDYVGGANAGTEQVWARANDGLAWGAWKNWLMSTEGGMLRGGLAPDTLNGEAGPTVLEGGGGGDTLSDSDGNNLFSGGDGSDEMTGGAGNDLFAGAEGDDTIHTGAGANVIAYNAGDGYDLVFSDAAAANTLSFGGGIGYDDLSLSKSGNDLIVNTGSGEGVVLKDWYAGNDNVLDLQVILDATEEFDAQSQDPLYNRKVQTFDFRGMVAQFDQALAQSPGLTSWALTNALLQFHLSGSDDEALGGDLAYWYGKNASFTGIGLHSAQQVIGAAGFGADAQTLRPFSGLQEGFVKLA